MASDLVQRSPLKFLDPPKDGKDFFTYLFRNIHNNLDSTAFIDLATGVEMTYREILTEVDALARGLRRHGFKRGQCLALYAVNSIEYVLLQLTALRLGGHFATITSQLTSDEAHTLFKLCDAEFMFVSQETAEKGQKASQGTQIKKIFGPGSIELTDLLLDSPGVPLPPLASLGIRDSEETAAILFSSGTTGPQKAVMLSHRNLVYQTAAMTDPQIISLGKHTLVFVPMSHLFGTASTLFTLASGNCVILLNGFQPKLFLDTIVKYKVSYLALPPPIAVFIAKHPMVAEYDLSSIETIGAGAAPLSAETEQEVCQRIGTNKVQFVQFYGLTESTGLITGPWISQRPSHIPPAPDGSVGLVFPQAEIKVVDIKTGESLGPGRDGEIWIRGPYVMLGYQKNQQQTNKTLDKQGWLHSGDIGRYDEHGYFYITDRLKELIKYKGFQVAPAELEALILTHPSVADCGVIGIPQLEAGELPHAWVVLKPGVRTTEQEIEDFVQGKVAQFKRLRGGVRFVDEIPKSPSGKILRRLMRDATHKAKL